MICKLAAGPLSGIGFLMPQPEQPVYNSGRIAIDQRFLGKAEQMLSLSYKKALDLQERRYIAQTQHTYAHLHILRTDLPAARIAFVEAIDLFERMGMREITAARTALTDLNAREQISAG